MKNLGEIRTEIDKIDTELIELFKKRMDCAKAVGLYKKENNIPVLNQNRENEILDNVEEKGGEYGSHARLLFSNIMELSRALQHNIVGSGKKLRADILNASSKMQTENVKVGYQGIKGANGHEATLKLFPNGDAVNYKTFADVFDAVDREEVTYGVLPVENSTAGSVSAVYDLILKHRFYIVKALDLPIDYCLAGLKQSEFSDIEKVWSHPQSLSQCANYIAKNNFDSTPFENTAVAAREVASEKRLNVAAICSYKAAEEYGLKILDNHLQDDKGNTTRFIVISKTLCIPENANKISLCFSLPHVTGSLYGLLCRFNSLGLNLTKIESRPRKGKDFEYLFYLDFSGSVYSDNVIDLISQLSEEMPEFSFLGNYCEL
ncbi:chorismate mutase [uncultured Ruminococcus sp.]|uniref:chorismate mutase n=1 Tax=uncultured Ruminococcus sp. TaxID=165186 RepID=UPI0025D145D0|nr:chorismate mutase [uncultured Ruminococcus sp.]